MSKSIKARLRACGKILRLQGRTSRVLAAIAGRVECFVKSVREFRNDLASVTSFFFLNLTQGVFRRFLERFESTMARLGCWRRMEVQLLVFAGPVGLG